MEKAVLTSLCVLVVVTAGPAQAAPTVNVINTIDNAEIVGAFNSGEGDTVLLNRMSAKRTSFRAALGV